MRPGGAHFHWRPRLQARAGDAQQMREALVAKLIDGHPLRPDDDLLRFTGDGHGRDDRGSEGERSAAARVTQSAAAPSNGHGTGHLVSLVREGRRPYMRPRRAGQTLTQPQQSLPAATPAAGSLGGMKVAIVGYPNVGKSSLVNRLTQSRE